MPPTPRRLIGPFDATMLVVGSMIGSGIFIVSAESARQVGTPGRLLAVWIAAGFMTLLAALSCAELAVMFPAAGGPYVFFREAYGPMAGFLFGWTMVLVIQTGTIAAVAMAFAKFFGVLVPAVAGTRAKVVASGVVIVLTVTNALGLKTGTRIQNVLTVVKYAALLALTAGGMFLAVAPPEAAPAAAVSASAPVGIAFALAFALALVGPSFSQSAWTNVTFPGGEVKDPGKTFPVALLLGCFLVAALYVLANVGYLRALGFDGIAHAPSDRVGTAVADRLWPGAGGTMMAGAILVSTFGCANGLILSGARVIYALAADGLFLAPGATLNRFGVPGLALAGQAVWASLLVASGTYSDLLKYVVSVELIVLILLVTAVPVLRRRRPDAPRGYRTWGYPLTPAIFVLLAASLAALLAIAEPRTTWPGYLLVLLGVPVYLVRARRAVPA
jgi:APA family basic amino acid/polyamine antiporter